MQHLAPERLAALADEPPTADEGAHLAACPACRQERDAYVALLALAQREGAGDRVGDAGPDADTRLPTAAGAPLASWDAIAAALRADGLIDPAAAEGATTRELVTLAERPAAARGRVLPFAARRSPWSDRRVARPFIRGAGRAAAAAVLVAGGVLAGRVTAGAPALPIAATAGPEAARLAATPPAAASPTAEADPTAGTLLTVGGGEEAAFSSIDEAAQTLARAQRDYQRAAAFLAEHDPNGASAGSDLLRARLAALDEVMPRVREALSEVPEDPVLNQVYLTTYDVRESTLRQLGRALPVGARMAGY